MKKQVLLLGIVFFAVLMLTIVGVALATPTYAQRSGHTNDCFYCHDSSQGDPTATTLNTTGRAYRAEGYPATDSEGNAYSEENPWTPSATGEQYDECWGQTALDDPVGGCAQVAPVLEETFGGIGIIGPFFGGDAGPIVKYDGTGALMESLARGASQNCTKSGCHSDKKDQPHYMGMKPSGTDCYLCHTKHVACAVCHELGQGGDSITNVINRRLVSLGLEGNVPPVIDEAIREVPIIDGHKAIRHGGLIARYAPGDAGAVFETVRSIGAGKEPSHLGGTVDETDKTLKDESMWKTNQLSGQLPKL